MLLRFKSAILAGVMAGIVLVGCGGPAEQPSGQQPAIEASPQIGELEDTVTPVATEEPGAAATEEATAPAEEEGSTASGVTTDLLEDGIANTKLNLNTASEEDFLNTIPGLGERMVDEFMEYRPYASIQQFRQEIGKYVDEQMVAQYEQFVYVPIDVNNSDAATLQQIPGVDETEAEELVTGRPYESTDAFLAKLAEYVPEEEMPTAQIYLNEP